jgi:polyhydroxyalkanoate synthesis regulator phasin
MNLEMEMREIHDETTRRVVQEMWTRMRHAIDEVDKEAAIVVGRVTDLENRIANIEQRISKLERK